MASSWLASWLESLNLAEYTDLFTEHGYLTSESFLAVDKSELKRVGLGKVGHQNRLLRAVDRLRLDAAAASSPPSLSLSLAQPEPPPQPDGPSNGLPAPEPVNSEPLNHTHPPTLSPQLSPITPSSASSSTSTSSQPVSLTAHPPPPVPIRRSIRKQPASDSSVSLNPPSAVRPDSIAPLPLHMLDCPPPVKPRQQSLRRRSQSPEPTAASTSSSATLPGTRQPKKSQSAAMCSSQDMPTAREKSVSEPTMPNHTPPSEVGHVITADKVKPKPSPRMQRKARSQSEQPTTPTTQAQRPVPMPRKFSGSKTRDSSAQSPTEDGSQRAAVEGDQKPISTPVEGTQTPILAQVEGAQKTLPPVDGDQNTTLPPVDGDQNTTLSQVDGGQKATLPLGEEAHNSKPPLQQQSEAGPLSVESGNMVPPAIPAKRSTKSWRKENVITPENDVVFELENVPLPSTTTALSETPGQPDLPTVSASHTEPLPPATPELPLTATKHTPPPSPTQRDTPSSIPVEPTTNVSTPANDISSPVAGTKPPPAPPQRRTNVAQTLPQHTTPPPAPPRKSTLPHPDSALPLVPPREVHSLPPFTPPPPSHTPPTTTSPLHTSSTPPPPTSPPPHSPPPSSPPPPLPAQISTPPPLPPKEMEIPPPPPPLSEQEDSEYSEDFSDSEEEDNGQFMSITSGTLGVKSPAEDDVLSLSVGGLESPQGVDSDEISPSPLTPLSSEENTPKHFASLSIRQQSRGSLMNIIVMSPETPVVFDPIAEVDDYANQEVIDTAAAKAVVAGEDYANQEVIDKAVSKAVVAGGEDYANQEVIDKAVSKAVVAGGEDYANQEVIDKAVSKAVVAGGEDYTNQEVIDTAKAVIAGEDYANQEVIDKVVAKAVAEDEGDYAEQNKIGTIRGATPIRSRTLTPNECDYMNQEVLDEDIIPVGILVPSATAVPVHIPEHVRLEMPEQNTRDYVNLQDKPAQLAAGQGNGRSSADGALPIDTGSDPQHDIFAVPKTLMRPESPRSSRGVSPERIIMTATDERATTLDYKGSPAASRILTPEPGSLKPSVSVSSDPSSGATTPGSLEGDNYFELKEIDMPSTHPIPPPTGSGFNRVAASMYKPTGRGRNENSLLPPSSGTFSCHNRGRERHVRPRKHTSVDSIDYSHDMISPLLEKPEDVNVPKTKEGYLHKKGGKKSQRPWQKRWMVFSGEELKYFNDKNYKESDALNHVRLRDMIDVKKISDTSDKQHYRFDLVVIGRVFQFYADSREECESWVSVLFAAIARFQPDEEEKVKEGGNLHDPDKQGILLKQGRGMRQGFKERYIALKGSKFAYYENREAFSNARPIHILELALANVRQDMSGKNRFIITMHNQKTYTFQASNEVDRSDWLDKITMAIMAGLVGGEKAPAAPTKNETTVQEIISRIQENPANKKCADCMAVDPSWGVCNLGIMVCIECSGVHRSMGIHISKVRSLELDRSIWTDNLIKLMVAIGNDRSNTFWEQRCQRERLPGDVEREIRETYIRAKYQDRSWIPEHSGEGSEALSRQLCVCVAGNNLMRSVQLLVHGADVCFVNPDESNPELKTALGIAKHHKQDLQVELLEQNRALSCQRSQTEVPQIVSKKGYLFKTGSDRTGWKRRWCTVDQFRGIEYFKSETDPEVQGDIKVHEMLSISRCDEENSKDPKYCYCFEVNTQGRGYLFSADSKEEMESWVDTLEKVIPRDSAENMGFQKVGYLRKKDPHNVGGWKRRWFTLKGKSLVYYKREREELAEIDLKKMTELKPPDPTGTAEAQCSFQIHIAERVVHLKADTALEADTWIQALRHTQVSGIPLSEQKITTGGIPIIVHKCLQFVETFGLEVEGIYRMSGNISKIRKLVLAFNQDASGVMIDTEDFTVHDVAGALKDFFKSLPDPLLTHHLHPVFIGIMQSDHEQQLYQLKAHIQKLPAVNKETLKRVISHLRKVIDNESMNKMSKSNLVSLFAPTLMTVNDDAVSSVSMANTTHEFACIGRMIECYKWLFEVDDEEEAREREMEAAKKRILQASEKKNEKVGMSSTMKFLNTIYILNKSGDTYGTYITPVTLVGEVVEEVATKKALPPDYYALYLVIGDLDSYRVLSTSDRLLAVLSSVGSDCYLCLKPNTFYANIKSYMQHDGWETVNVHVREKKKWKKYPCAVRGNSFVQFKDNKCAHELARLPVSELDMFAGMERSVRTDHKNPMPTRNFFWLKPMRGMEEQTKYLCADSEQDLLKLMAALVNAKYGPDGLQSPLVPTHTLPADQLAFRRSTISVSPKTSPGIQRKEKFGYSLQYDKR